MLKKTHYIQFKTKNKPKTHIKITYYNKQILKISKIKFLGTYINDTINWKYHIEFVLPTLSAICYAMRIIKPYVSLEMLKIVHYSNFNSTINYGLPFWGTSPHGKKIFRMQKKIVRIMMGHRKEASSRNLFRKLKILPQMSQYILSLMMSITKNKNQFTVNSEIHSINTRQQWELVDGSRRREMGISGGGSLRRRRPTQACSAEKKKKKNTRQHTNLHQPTSNLTGYQQGI